MHGRSVDYVLNPGINFQNQPILHKIPNILAGTKVHE